jgi:competence protein ComEC
MKRPLLWASVGMLAGIALMCFRQASLAILSAVILIIFLRNRKHRILFFGLLTGLFLGCFSGFCYRYSSQNLRKGMNSATCFTGVVRDVSGHGFRMRVTSFGNEFFRKSYRNIYSYYVYVASEEIPALRANVTVTGHAEDFRPAENPGQFDASAYYPSVGCIAYIRADSLQINRQPKAFFRFLGNVRERISVQLNRLFPKETVGLPMALMLGEKNGFDGDQKELYEQFGLAHILAVSGLHIGILSEFLLFLFLILFPRKPAEILTFSVLLIYGALCGFPVSCIRAVFTFFLFAFCGHFKRTFDRISANSFLLILILFLAPYRLSNLSFQLSFTAGYLTSFEPFKMGEKKSLKKIFRTSVLLQAGLLPFTLQAFYTITPVGIFLNVFVLAGIGAGFVLVLSATAISWALMPVARFLAGPVHYGELLLVRVMQLLRSLPFLTMTAGHPSRIRIAVFLAFFVTVYYLERRYSERYRYLLLAGFLLFIPIHYGITVASLSVGQGECTVILSGRRVTVLDCGSNSKEEVGEKILKPYLQYMGYSHVDYLFLSHMDEDHINGIRNCSVFTSVKCVYTDTVFGDVSSFLSPSVGTKTKFIETRGGDAVTIGKLEFRFLTSDHSNLTETDTNELCQITEVIIQGYRFLFPGDVSAEVLEQIPADILYPVYYLKVPHHGSRFSVSENFYERITPFISVISVGYNNYGHPSKEATSLARAYSTLYITKTDGAIITEFRRGKPYTYSYLKSKE